MVNFFLNANFLAVAGALVSVPIIIHLINRMRFKRIRWAAMEFLLKAQKRKRKRLIIEQLILLALRCLLVALVGMLVARFVGPALAEGDQKPNLHIVLLDDTLSMQERIPLEEDKKKGKEAPKGAPKASTSAFRVGLEENTLIKIIGATYDEAGNPSKAWGPDDELVVLPLSRFVQDPTFKPKFYDHLNDEKKFKEMEKEVRAIAPTQLYVPLVAGVQKVGTLIDTRRDSRVYLHLVGDFRKTDWANPEIQKELTRLTTNNSELKVQLVDALLPKTGGKGAAKTHENLAITELRPLSRFVAKNVPIDFVMKVKNFGNQDKRIDVLIYDELQGKKHEANFLGPMPAKVPANSEAQFVFNILPLERKRDVAYKGEHLFLSARLTSPDIKEHPLEGDSLPDDNIRYTSVEVRERIPVLLIDGRPRETERDLQDWRSIWASLDDTHEFVFGEDIGAGSPVRALNHPDLLHKFSAIYLLNVKVLDKEQIANLEAFVAGGGGASFFMGPDISQKDYNQDLYRAGTGLFPVQLGDLVTVRFREPPKEAKAEKDAKKPLDTQDLILRDRFYPDLKEYPIFGKMLQDGMDQLKFRNVNVRNYFQIKGLEALVENAPKKAGPAKDDKEKKEKEAALARAPWNVQVLATLTSEKVIDDVVDEQIVKVFFSKDRKSLPLPETAPFLKVLDNAEFATYHPGLKTHRDRITRAMRDIGEDEKVKPKVQQLARPLFEMLIDPGAKIVKDDKLIQDPRRPDMREFWDLAHPDVVALRKQIVDLYENFAYGDPLVVAARFGQGKVVVVLTTAYQRWSGWGAAGSTDSTFPVFAQELQRYLGTAPPPPSLLLGKEGGTLTFEKEVLKQREVPALKIHRFFLTPSKEGATTKEEDVPGKEADGKVTFQLPSKNTPGMSVAELTDKANNIVASVAHTFNVPVEYESALRQYKEAAEELHKRHPERIVVVGQGDVDDSGKKAEPVSESAWFFLLLICVLIAEQALAVHLSFHLKGDEMALPAQAGKTQAAPRAA